MNTEPSKHGSNSKFSYDVSLFMNNGDPRIYEYTSTTQKLYPEYGSQIFKLLRNPRIDSKESIPPAYEAWRAGTIPPFLLGS
jgi:hypothetical protein